MTASRPRAGQRSRLPGLTLDTGALIAAGRGDRRFMALWQGALRRGVVPVVPAGVLAQAWRGPAAWGVNRVVRGSIVEALDEPRAKAAGELCGRAGTADPVDASVVLSAARRGDIVATGDIADLRVLAAHVPGVVTLTEV